MHISSMFITFVTIYVVHTHTTPFFSIPFRKRNTPLTLVVNLDVPDEVILSRISDRWVHVPSGRVYNMSYNRPRVEGFDDVTGEPLTRRPDDNPVRLLRSFTLAQYSATFSHQLSIVGGFCTTIGGVLCINFSSPVTLCERSICPDQ